MAACSGSGFGLAPPPPAQRALMEADLTVEEANVLLRRGTEAPDFTPEGEPLPDRLGRGAPEGEPWQGR